MKISTNKLNGLGLMFLMHCLISLLIFLPVWWLGMDQYFTLGLWLVLSFLWSIFFSYYQDRIILGALGARKVTQGNYALLHERLAYQAFRLRMQQPSLYIYNGYKRTGFILSRWKKTSLVVDQALIESLSSKELDAFISQQLLMYRAGFYRGYSFWMSLVLFFYFICSALSKPLAILKIRKAFKAYLSYIFIPLTKMCLAFNQFLMKPLVNKDVFDQHWTSENMIFLSKEQTLFREMNEIDGFFTMMNKDTFGPAFPALLLVESTLPSLYKKDIQLCLA